MQERLERVETKIDRLETKIDNLDARVDGLSNELVAVETRLGDRLVAVETRLGDRIGRSEVQIDHLRGDLQKVAEGYTVGLNAISRQITAFQTDLNTKLLDRDLVLQDHGRRISALEQSGSQ